MQVTFASSPGRVSRPNEDFVVATDGLVVLLDGAGGPDELAKGCHHGVTWLVRHVGNHLVNELLNTPDLDLATALARSITQVADLHRDTCNLDHPGTPSATVAIVREGPTTVDYLVLADATVVIEHDGEITAVSDHRIDDVAPEEREAMARFVPGTPEHQRHRVARVRAQQQRRNTPEGFWVVAAQPEAAEHAYTGSLPRRSVTRAALLSDGAARAQAWELLDWRQLLQAAEDNGPAAVTAEVREAEDTDREGLRWPRVKHADDATVAFCQFAAAGIASPGAAASALDRNSRARGFGVRGQAASLPGSAGVPNEDWWVASGDTAIVIDGVSAPAGDIGCHHGTPWFVRRLAGHLAAQVTDEGRSLPEALGSAIDAVAQLHKDTCDLSHPGTPSAAVAVMRRRGEDVEYLVIADALVILDTQAGLEVFTDKRVDNTVIEEREAALRHPVGSPEHDELLQLMIERQRRLRNAPGGYWVVQNDPIAAQHAVTGSRAAAEVRGGVVMSDGVSRIVDLYAKASWQSLYTEAHTNAGELLRQIRTIEDGDPEGTTWPRYKKSDDATVVACDWTL